MSRSLVVLFVMLCFGMPGMVLAQSPQSGSASVEQLSYAAMADVLEDEQAREQLIAELRRLAAEEPGQDEALAGATPAMRSSASGVEISLPRRIAYATQAFAETVGDRLSDGGALIAGLATADNVSARIDLPALTSASVRLGLLVVGTVIVFFILRGLSAPVFAACGRWAARDSGHSLLRRALAISLSVLVDLIAIVLAGIGGYALALFVLGDRGALEASSSLFLNAFVLIEAFKALLRMVFAVRYDSLRLFTISADSAEYWNRWLARLSGFIGYGLLVAVPLVSANASAASGQVLSLVIMLLAYIYALVVILKNRVLLRQRLQTRAAFASMGLTSVLQRLLARIWHLLAIAYFTVLLVVSQARPDEALSFMLHATLETVIAIGVGLFVASALSRLLRRRIELSDDLRRRIPTLEKRLNAYVPTGLKVMRAVILIAVMLAVLNAWAVFDVPGWLGTATGLRLVTIAVKVAIILALAALLWMGVASAIEHRLSPETGRGEPSAREKTLLSLFSNALAIIFITITLMVTLSQIGIDIGPLIAGAGVLGLAIGFGAQKLVQDIITGVFIQLENAMNTGDVVTVAGVSGTVERLTVRSVGIRDLAGTYHIIPFSSVDNVANYMRGFAFHVGEYRIAYRENIDEAVEHLKAAFVELRADPGLQAEVLDDIEISGVTALADSSVNIRVRIMTTPGNQWAVGRAYNRLVKGHFDAAGIEIPVPQLAVTFGQGKSGTAAPANVALIDQATAAADQRERVAARQQGDTSADKTREFGDLDWRKQDSDPEGA